MSKHSTTSGGVGQAEGLAERLDLDPVAEEPGLEVEPDEVEQVAAVAPLRDRDPDAPALELGEVVLDRRVDLLGEHDLLRDRVLGVVLDQELGQELLVEVEDELLLAGQGAEVDLEEREVDRPLDHDVVEDVLVVGLLPVDPLVLGEGLDRVDLLAPGQRLLELVPGRVLGHLLAERPQEIAVPPLQALLGPPHGLGVLVRRDRADARAQAGVHVVPEAGALGELPAGPEPERLAEALEEMVALEPRDERAVVGAPLALLPRDHEPRVGLVRAEDVGVGLGVLEDDVVPGPVPLDQGVLEDQGLDLGRGHDEVEVRDVADERGRLGVEVAPGEVGRDPPPQVLGLAHVDDRPVRVGVEVAAGKFGEALEVDGRSRHSTCFRNWPVYDRGLSATSSGVPTATTSPPSSPPSGPRSIT